MYTQCIFEVSRITFSDPQIGQEMIHSNVTLTCLTSYVPYPNNPELVLCLSHVESSMFVHLFALKPSESFPFSEALRCAVRPVVIYYAIRHQGIPTREAPALPGNTCTPAGEAFKESTPLAEMAMMSYGGFTKLDFFFFAP